MNTTNLIPIRPQKFYVYNFVDEKLECPYALTNIEGADRIIEKLQLKNCKVLKGAAFINNDGITHFDVNGNLFAGEENMSEKV